MIQYPCIECTRTYWNIRIIVYILLCTLRVVSSHRLYTSQWLVDNWTVKVANVLLSDYIGRDLCNSFFDLELHKATLFLWCSNIHNATELRSLNKNDSRACGGVVLCSTEHMHRPYKRICSTHRQSKPKNQLWLRFNDCVVPHIRGLSLGVGSLIRCNRRFSRWNHMKCI